MPAAIYKQKGMTEAEYANLLRDLYIIQGKSHFKISKILNVCPDAIERHCRKYGIKSRDRNDYAQLQVKTTDISKRQMDILNGVVLSDGCLDGSGSTISARLTLGFKYKETIDDIVSELSCFKFSPIWQCPQTTCYHIKSHSYKEIKDLRNKWYNGRVKIVPKCLELTSLTCLYWFMGDGFGVNSGFMLCTDSFQRDENNSLVKRLLDINILSHVTPKNRIRVRGKSAEDFKDMIERDKKILEHYKYKFNYKRKKYTNA